MLDLGGVAGQPRLGFWYWVNPGPFAQPGLVGQPNADQFLGVISGLVQAAYTFQGMELAVIAASETQSPRRNIGRAVRRVFFRICFFYTLGIFVAGLIVPWNDPNLLSTISSSASDDTAAHSPFVIAMTRTGATVLPSVINAGLLTSVFSAGNAFLFCSSRILYGLSLRGQAPKVFAYCTREGLPIAAVLFASIFSLLSFISVSEGSTQGFDKLVHLATVTYFFNWWSISLTFIFFRERFKCII